MVEKESEWWRGLLTECSGDDLIPGHNASPGRFSPLGDTSHTYIGANRTVAILESALHRASGVKPKIFLAEVNDHVLAEVSTTQHLRLVDLRDPELERLSIERAGLVATTPRHYPCTRQWAEALQGRRPGGHQVHGIIWHSRQADAYAQSHSEGLIADLLSHRQTEVAVLWSPHCPEEPLKTRDLPEQLVDDDGEPSRLLIELSVLIQAPIE